MATTAPVTVTNARSVSRALIQISRRTPPDRLAELIGGVGVRDVKRGIRTQRLPDGRPYKGVQRFGKAGQRLRDTSRMLNSITFQVLSSRRVVVGTNAKQAPLQHYGGEVRAKGGKFLAIPLSRQVQAAYSGSFRQMYPDAFVLKLSGKSFGYERLFLVRKMDKGTRGPAGTVFKVRKRDGKSNVKFAGARLQFLALLVKKVRIPATPFLGISREGENEMVRVAQVAITKVMQEAGAK